MKSTHQARSDDPRSASRATAQENCSETADAPISRTAGDRPQTASYSIRKPGARPGISVADTQTDRYSGMQREMAAEYRYRSTPTASTEKLQIKVKHTTSRHATENQWGRNPNARHHAKILPSSIAIKQTSLSDVFRNTRSPSSDLPKTSQEAAQRPNSILRNTPHLTAPRSNHWKTVRPPEEAARMDDRGRAEGSGNPWTDPRKITYRVAPRPEMDGRRRVPCGSHLSSAPASAIPA